MVINCPFVIYSRGLTTACAREDFGYIKLVYRRLRRDPMEEPDCDKRPLEEVFEIICLRAGKKQRRCSWIYDKVLPFVAVNDTDVSLHC